MRRDTTGSGGLTTSGLSVQPLDSPCINRLPPQSSVEQASTAEAGTATTDSLPGTPVPPRVVPWFLQHEIPIRQSVCVLDLNDTSVRGCLYVTRKAFFFVRLGALPTDAVQEKKELFAYHDVSYVSRGWFSFGRIEVYTKQQSKIILSNFEPDSDCQIVRALLRSFVS